MALNKPQDTRDKTAPTSTPRMNLADTRKMMQRADLATAEIVVSFEQTARPTPVIHSLRRKPQGFTVITKDADMNIWQTADDMNASTNRIAYFHSSAVGTAKLEVR